MEDIERVGRGYAQTILSPLILKSEKLDETSGGEPTPQT